MDLRIEVDEPDAAEALRSSTDWLKDEGWLRGPCGVGTRYPRSASDAM
jgi:hypothetical protein